MPAQEARSTTNLGGVQG